MQKIWVSLFLLCFMSSPFAEAKSIKKDRLYYEKRGEVVWEVPTDQKVICLTFDDGPDAQFTQQILDLLKEQQAKATFFVTGRQVQKYPELAKQQVQDGHELANHTFSHPNLRRISEGKLREEILQTEKVIQAVTGQNTKLFRPPGGDYNDTIINTAKNEGYTVIMWSWHQDTKDWTDPGIHKIVNKVLSNARNGDIVLFHDYGGNRSQTVKALKEILPVLKQRGYHFITVSELLHIKQNRQG